MTVLFVVGPPGAGKTTLVRELLAMQGRELPIGSYLVPAPKWTVCPEVCAAGHYTGDTFDGADTVPYNGVADALVFWEKELARLPLTILDGDRFSHVGALEWFRERKAVIRGVFVDAPEELLAERRAGRGSNQNPAWVKGRVTKSKRFADYVNAATIPAVWDLQDQVRAVRELLP